MPAVYFLVLRDKDSDPQILGFYLLIPMVYVDSDPFFCAATKTVKDQVLKNLHARGAVSENPLETLEEYLPP